MRWEVLWLLSTSPRFDEERWRAAWELKVFGYINLCRLYYARMKAAGGGVIVNNIGNGGEISDPRYIAGGVGNASLMTFTRALGGSSLVDNIRVVGVNPGPVDTERIYTMLKKRAKDAQRPRRLGMLVPSSNTVLEPATASLAQFGIDGMLAAAELLADARVALLLWNGTAASWLGFERDDYVVAAIQERTGIRATTALSAMNEALARIGARRLGLSRRTSRRSRRKLSTITPTAVARSPPRWRAPSREHRLT